jgi:hypothetical protein
MQRTNRLTHALLAGVAVLNLSIAQMATAQPNTVIRGPHGAAFIQDMDSSFPMKSMKHGMFVKPFNLVFLAYQGFFASEGIPSAGALIQATREGKVSPEALTNAAIKMNRLPADTINDSQYLADVKSQLDTLVTSDN